MKTAYVKHPVSREEIAKIRAEGFTIVDLEFKPEELQSGDKVFGVKKRRAKKTTG